MLGVIAGSQSNSRIQNFRQPRCGEKKKSKGYFRRANLGWRTVHIIRLKLGCSGGGGGGEEKISAS